MERKQEFSSIWFATQTQMKNRFRFLNFSDRGSLNVSGSELHFKGHKYNILIKNIKSIDPTYALFPWGSMGLAIIFSVMFLCSYAWFLRLETIPPYRLLFVFNSIILLLLALTIVLIQKTTLWVEVVYLDDDNVLQSAYFFDGSFLGWRGILGDSLQLYKKIKASVFSATN